MKDIKANLLQGKYKEAEKICGDMDEFEYLMEWFERNCNGQWEHQYGIEIATIDNPGWYIKIDLLETPYADLCMKEIKIDNGENDWMECSIMNGIFQGAGDILKLRKILQTFREVMDAESL